MERLYKYGITREIRPTKLKELGLIDKIEAMIESGYSTEEIKEYITKIIEKDKKGERKWNR